MGRFVIACALILTYCAAFNFNAAAENEFTVVKSPWGRDIIVDFDRAAESGASGILILQFNEGRTSARRSDAPRVNNYLVCDFDRREGFFFRPIKSGRGPVVFGITPTRLKVLIRNGYPERYCIGGYDIKSGKEKIYYATKAPLGYCVFDYFNGSFFFEQIDMGRFVYGGLHQNSIRRLDLETGEISRVSDTNEHAKLYSVAPRARLVLYGIKVETDTPGFALVTASGKKIISVRLHRYSWPGLNALILNSKGEFLCIDEEGYYSFFKDVRAEGERDVFAIYRNGNIRNLTHDAFEAWRDFYLSPDDRLLALITGYDVGGPPRSLALVNVEDGSIARDIIRVPPDTHIYFSAWN